MKALSALLALIALASFAYAQNECFLLTGSQVCPDLATSSVRAVDGQFASVSEFDTYMLGQMNNNTNYLKEFQDFYNCPLWDGTMQRFHMSVLCYFMVQMSNCEQATPALPLCKSSCNEYIDSLQDIFSNSTLCPVDNAESTKRRDLALGSGGYAPYCDWLTADNATTGACSAGLAMEVANCGFFDADDGTKFCALPENVNSTCCTTMTIATLKGVSDGLLDSNGNVWIITGVSIGAAVILIILFILYIRARGWHRKTTAAVQPIVFDDKKNDFTPKNTNRFTQRLSRSMGALFKPKGRANDMKSFQSPSPFRGGPNGMGGGAGGNWETEPLPAMPNVTTIKKKPTNNSLPRNKKGPESEMMQSSMPTKSNPAPAPLSLLSNLPPMPSAGPSAAPMSVMTAPITAPMSIMTEAQPQAGRGPIDTYAGAQSVVSYLPDTQFTLMKALEEFFPSLDDEIQLQPGDRVQVVESFDDGWAVGKNLTSNEVGAFPIACVASMETVIDVSSNRKSEYRSRTHSLYAPRK